MARLHYSGFLNGHHGTKLTIGHTVTIVNDFAREITIFSFEIFQMGFNN